MNDYEQISELEDLLMQAIKHRNTCSLEKLLHQELAFIDRDGEVSRKTEDFENNHISTLYTPKMENCERQINMKGNTAMVLLIEKSRGRYGKLPFEGKLRYMHIWKKIGNDWKVAAAS